jgi:hypothetical protein
MGNHFSAGLQFFWTFLHKLMVVLFLWGTKSFTAGKKLMFILLSMVSVSVAVSASWLWLTSWLAAGGKGIGANWKLRPLEASPQSQKNVNYIFVGARKKGKRGSINFFNGQMPDDYLRREKNRSFLALKREGQRVGRTFKTKKK